MSDKDRFNDSHPKNDKQLATYVRNPTLPVTLAENLGIPGAEPKYSLRGDFVSVLLVGIQGLVQPAHVVTSEMHRLALRAQVLLVSTDTEGTSVPPPAAVPENQVPRTCYLGPGTHVSFLHRGKALRDHPARTGIDS